MSVTPPRHLRIPYQQLVIKQQYDKIMDVLLKDQNSYILRMWLEGSKIPLPDGNHHHSAIGEEESMGDNALHRIAVVHPPAWIVEALVNCMTELYPNYSPLDVTDKLGRTPLHIATIHGSIDAIPILTYGGSSSSNDDDYTTSPLLYTSAPILQDKWLRCPLHWACTHSMTAILSRNNTRTHRINDSYVSSTNECTGSTFLSKLICQSRNGTKKTIDMFDAVRILLASYPEATMIRDSDGKTPLELAIDHHVDPNIIRMVSTIHYGIKKCNNSFFWNSSSGMGETTSVTLSESERFPDGFPGEICVYNKTKKKRTKHPQPRRFEYKIFEC